MDGNIDPKKNVHLRPKNNPFSIFGGSEADDEVPDIFSNPTPKVRKAAAPVAVPGIDQGFSLLPKTNSSSSGREAKSPKKKKSVVTDPDFALPRTSSSSSSTRIESVASEKERSTSVPFLERERQPYLSQPAAVPPVGVPSSSSLDDPNDSFDEDDDVQPLHPPPPLHDSAKETQIAELELKLAQMKLELVSVKDQNTKMSAMLEKEQNARREKDEELKRMQLNLEKVKQREQEENQALEGALGAIEAKLQAANLRASKAEAEAASLRSKLEEIAGEGTVGDQLATAKKNLRRVNRQAHNMSLDFTEATNKTQDAVKELTNTMMKLSLALRHFEKLVPEEEEENKK